MKILKLELEKAQQAFKKGDAETKRLLIDLYGEEHFLVDVKDRLKDYASACAILNIQPLTLEQFTILLGKEKGKRAFARHKIATGIEAINEGWKPDFDNPSQYKWYNYFRGKSYGFSSDSAYIFGDSDVGLDLYIETSEKADLIAKIFREEYIEYLF